MLIEDSGPQESGELRSTQPVWIDLLCSVGALGANAATAEFAGLR